MTDSTARVNDLSVKTAENLESYVRQLDQLQGYVAQDLAGIQQLISNNAELTQQQMNHMQMLVDYEKQIGEFSEEFSRAAAAQLETLGKSARAGVDAVTESSRKSADASAAAVKTIAAASENNLNNAVRFADDMTGGMTASARELTEATDRLTRQLDASLKSTIDSYNRMQQELESMIYAMDVLRRNTVSMNQLRNE